MKTESEIREALSRLDARLVDLDKSAEGRALSPEDQAEFDAGITARRELAEELRAIETRKAAIAELARNQENHDGAEERKRSAEFMQRVDPTEGDARTMSRAEARDKALKLLESDSAVRHLEDRQIEAVDRTLRRRTVDTDGTQVARRMLLTENDVYRSAFVKLVTRTSPILTADEARAIEEFDEFRASSLTDASGGYGVPVLIDPTIILTAQGSPNDIINLARVETITNDEWKGVSSAGVSWSFDAEAAEVSDDAPTLAQPTVTTHKAQGFIPYSIEIGMDYPNFAAEMSTLLDEGYRELLAEKLTTGSGSGEPFGIVTALDANTNVEVAVTSDGVFQGADVYKLWDALPIKYRRRNPVWMSSTDMMNEVRQLATGSDNSDANFSVNITQETIPRLFGKQYYENDFMADFTGTTGAANLMVLGDFSNYLVAQRAGMNVELVPHLFGTTNNRPTGQRGWYAWARVGADSINDLAFRLLQNQ